MDRDRLATVALYSVPVLFLLLFLAYPILSLLGPAFTDESGGFSLKGFRHLLESERSLGIISFTLWQAILSTLLTVSTAIPGAYLLSRYEFRGKALLLSLTTVPFVLPPLVLGIGFILIFGTNGYLQSLIDIFTSVLGTGSIQVKVLYTKQAIILAHLFLNFPIALRILHSRMETLDPDIVDASRSLGAGPIRTFLKIILPQLKYSILSASSLIFTFCLLTFGVVMVVGGMANATLEMEIYRQYVGSLDEGKAAVLLLIEVLLVALSTSLYLWSSRKEGSLTLVAKGPGIGGSAMYGSRGHRSVITILYILIIGVVVLGPMAAVVHDSFVQEKDGEDEYTTRWYEGVISREDDPTIGASPLGAVMNSLLFGFLTIVAAVPLSLLTAYALDRPGFRSKRLFDTFLFFPLGVSTVALGIGMLSGFNQGWIDLGGSWIPIIIVHTIIAFPFGARAIMAVKREIPDQLVDAARSLGSSRLGAFINVELPLLARGIVIAMVFSFAISIGEFGATLMLAPPEYTTMPIAMYKFISGGRDFGSATAYAVMIMLVTFTSIFLIDMLGSRFWKEAHPQ